MNVETLIRRVQRTFGDESEALVTVQDIIDWINAGQRKIARETKCLQSQAAVAIDATANGYALPTNFVGIVRAQYTTVVLRQTTLDFITSMLGDTDGLQQVSGADAEQFYIWGNKIYLYPWPKVVSASNLQIWYTRLPVDVNDEADTPEIPEFMHEDIITYCLAEAHKMDANWEAARSTAQEFTGDIAQSREEQDNPNKNSYAAVRVWDGDVW